MAKTDQDRRDAAAERKRRYLEKHRERILAERREHYARNREAEVQRVMAYQRSEKGKKSYQSCMTRFREKHKDAIAAKKAAWKRNKREQPRALNPLPDRKKTKLTPEERRRSRSERQRLRYANDPEYRERVMQACRRRYAELTQHQKAHLKKVNQRNEAKIKDTRKKYRKQHAERISEHQKAMRPAIRKQRRERYANDAAYRATISAQNAARKRSGKHSNPSERRLIEGFYEECRSTKKIRCYWCAAVTTSKTRHVDHIVALANGGGHTLSNLCIACIGCNLKKADKPPEKFSPQLILF